MWGHRRVVPLLIVTGAPMSGVGVGVVALVLHHAVATALVRVVVGAMLWAALLVLLGALKTPSEQSVTKALNLRDGGDGARADIATAARMVVSSVPSVASMAEATALPF